MGARPDRTSEVGYAIFGVFPDHLVVRKQSIVDASLLKQKIEEGYSNGPTHPAWTVDLSYRDLSYADLQGADLRLADFQSSSLVRTILTRAQLNGANLVNAKLSGAIALHTELSGADLDGAELFGTNFKSAWLNNAEMWSVKALAANFRGAQLQGATAYGARMDGSSFDNANLQLVTFGRPNLQASDFFNTSLQGAEFSNCELQATRFTDAYMYRTRILESTVILSSAANALKVIQAARFEGPKFEALKRQTASEEGPITVKDVDEWYDLSVSGSRREAEIKSRKARSDQLRPGFAAADSVDTENLRKMAEFLHSASATELANNDSATKILAHLACLKDTAPDVARALLELRPDFVTVPEIRERLRAHRWVVTRSRFDG